MRPRMILGIHINWTTLTRLLTSEVTVPSILAV
jgi:hypothetical protein